jgi:hypothetical protein
MFGTLPAWKTAGKRISFGNVSVAPPAQIPTTWSQLPQCWHGLRAGVPLAGVAAAVREFRSPESMGAIALV